MFQIYRLFASEDGVNFARFDAPRNAPFVPHQFTEIALTWEFGSNPVLYVNKIPYPMTLSLGAMPSSLFATSAPLCIGFDPDYVPSRNLNGLIRNVRLWKDVVLSPEQVNQPITGNEPGLVGYWKADEGEGTILTDSSPNANHGTITNGSWESVSLGVLRPDEYREVYQTDQPVTIDELVWGAVGAEAQEGAELQIEIDGVPWRVTGQGEFLPITPKAINDSYALEWNIFAYDTTTHVYKFGLRSPLVCPNGCVIRIGNRGQGNVGSWIIRAIGREME